MERKGRRRLDLRKAVVLVKLLNEFSGEDSTGAGASALPVDSRSSSSLATSLSTSRTPRLSTHDNHAGG